MEPTHRCLLDWPVVDPGPFPSFPGGLNKQLGVGDTAPGIQITTCLTRRIISKATRMILSAMDFVLSLKDVAAAATDPPPSAKADPLGTEQSSQPLEAKRQIRGPPAGSSPTGRVASPALTESSQKDRVNDPSSPPKIKKNACQEAGVLLSDFHGFLIVRAEEVVGAILLHCLPAILSHVEHCVGERQRTALGDQAGGRDQVPARKTVLSKGGRRGGGRSMNKHQSERNDDSGWKQSVNVAVQPYLLPASTGLASSSASPKNIVFGTACIM